LVIITARPNVRHTLIWHIYVPLYRRLYITDFLYRVGLFVSTTAEVETTNARPERASRAGFTRAAVAMPLPRGI
jgi:hypothetical protein